MWGEEPPQLGADSGRGLSPLLSVSIPEARPEDGLSWELGGREWAQPGGVARTLPSHTPTLGSYLGPMQQVLGLEFWGE